MFVFGVPGTTKPKAWKLQQFHVAIIYWQFSCINSIQKQPDCRHTSESTLPAKNFFFTVCLNFFSDVNDCLRLDWTCENGGQQVDTGKSCKCQCAPGFNGHHCEIGQSLMSYNFKTGSLRVASLQCISRKTKTNAPRPRYASKYKHFLSTYAKKQNHRQ